MIKVKVCAFAVLSEGRLISVKRAEITAYAKINLVLDVHSKREDGYHEVSMVMQAIDLADTLVLEKASRNWLVTDNKFIPPNMNNLAMKAVLLMQKHYPQVPPLQVTLQKRIPVAAGLAGGSTDCAAVLMGINEMCGLNLTQQELEQLGAELGSDVPFCISGPTALATGRGEKIQALPECPELYIVLVKPQFGVSTPKVYGNLRLAEITAHPDVKKCVNALHAGTTAEILQSMGNVLENSTCQLHPQVETLKKEMIEEGCEHVLMSGSGPTVFAVFEEQQRAKQYYEKIKHKYPSATLTKTVTHAMLKERVKLYDKSE